MDPTIFLLVILLLYMGVIFGLIYVAVKMKGKKDELLQKIVKALVFVSVVILLPVSGVLSYLVITSDFAFPPGSAIYYAEPMFFWFGILTPALIIFSVIMSFWYKIKHGPETAAMSVMGLLSPLFTLGFLVFLVVVGGGYVGYVLADYVRAEYVQTEYVQNDEAGIPNIDAAALEIGNIAEFGGIYWRILDIQDGRVLLLSEYVIEQRPFQELGVTITLGEPAPDLGYYFRRVNHIRWADSSLRYFLNNEFYYRFSQEDRLRIAETTVVNSTDNAWLGTRVRDNTIDKIFLLSLEEVIQYFGDSSRFTEGGSGWGIDDQYNAARVAISAAHLVEPGESTTWWLRSSGGRAASAVTIGHRGTINMDGTTTAPLVGVRPALWLYSD